LIVGAPNRFHHGATHSIGAALVFATLLTLLLRLLGKEGGARPFLVFLGLYVSHLLLDYFGTDTSPPFGIPALWPASAATYMAPVTPFGDIHRTNSTADFFPSLFSAHNLWAVSLECLFLVPLLLLAFAWRKRRSAASGCSRTLAP
jgi:inner membrane protein